MFSYEQTKDYGYFLIHVRGTSGIQVKDRSSRAWEGLLAFTVPEDF